METAVKEGKYIYCIIARSEPTSFHCPGIGERGDMIHTICFNDISAVVSDSPVTSYSVSRKNLLDHEKAIEEVMKEHTVLPVRFCTIAEDEEQVGTILEKNYARFKDYLQKIEGKKELGLKAVFKDDVIYKDILEKHKDIGTLKEKIARLTPDKAYYQQIQIGRMVEEALESEKRKHKEEILRVLKPLAEDVKISETYGERMVVNASFLVSKDKEAEFDRNVRELDDRYGDRIKFKYVGNVPPFNFVNLVINTGTQNAFN